MFKLKKCMHFSIIQFNQTKSKGEGCMLKSVHVGQRITIRACMYCFNKRILKNIQKRCIFQHGKRFDPPAICFSTTSSSSTHALLVNVIFSKKQTNRWGKKEKILLFIISIQFFSLTDTLRICPVVFKSCGTNIPTANAPPKPPFCPLPHRPL